MNYKDIPKLIISKFKKFWKSENTKISLLRDIFIALSLVLIILLALWIYTGQWFGAPMVAIESGSMMHPNEPFGRIGTIDAGDMVLLVKVNSKSDISPQIARDPNEYHYWDYGDVIIYRPYGDSNRDQIIHRARCWVEVEYDNGNRTYTVEQYNITNAASVVIPELGLTKEKAYKPSHSGFITKGDNNNACDQLYASLCNEPIKVDWISGKARGELPWIGTINLFFNDLTNDGEDTVPNVPGDCIICLIILIGVLISIPISLDLYDHFKSKKQKNSIKKNIFKKEKDYKKLEEKEEKK